MSLWIILLGYLAACAAVAFTLSLILVSGTMLGGFVLYILVAVTVFSFVPAMLLIGFGLYRRFTGWSYYALSGAVLGFVLSFSFGGPSRLGSFSYTVQLAFLVAGFLGGLAFWVVAHGAGLWDRLATETAFERWQREKISTKRPQKSEEL